MGTSYSCVGVWQNDHVEIIANEFGNRKTPSYVAFTDTEILIGDAAKNQAAKNPHNTIFNASRLIGRSFRDNEVQSDMKVCPIYCKKKFSYLTRAGEVKNFFCKALAVQNY